MAKSSLNPNCRYNCVRGKYFDHVQKREVICPDCQSYRVSEVRSGYTADAGVPVKDVLGFDSEYQDFSLDSSKVLAKSAIPQLDPGSVTVFQKGLEEVYSKLVLGTAPKTSVCFGTDKNGNVDRIAVPFLLTAYKSALTVAPVLSTPVYRTSVVGFEDKERQYLSADVVIVHIPSGIGEGEILTAKGLMQSRASQGLSTIIVTSRPREHLDEILSVEGEESRYMATPYCVAYKKRSGPTIEGRVSEGASRLKTSPFGGGSGAVGPATSLDELSTL